MMDEKKNEDVDPIAAVEADPLPAEPRKPGCVRSFFKTKRMAIGICVLAVLLVANVAVFGAHKHCGKGFRDHGGRAVAECEYKYGPKTDKQLCIRGEISEKDCPQNAECGGKYQKEKGAVKGKGARGDK